ncbi:MAG TPA: ankyrin repeat domain-containing protein [Steroidobacteraceae bacterium]|nr:ankyrin repeat domain-containing protein [Steroidobacteraceae bacterium]
MRSLWAVATLLVVQVLCAPVARAGSEVADAVMNQDSARLHQLLGQKADVNVAQPDGSTALHWAAYHADVDAASRLIAAGANPSLVTTTGMTALALACQAGSAEVVGRLLKAGADPNQALSSGETPLMMAARTGSVAVLTLLLEHGAQIDAREKLRGTTALMWAAANANPAAVRLLAQKGADVNARSAATRPGRPPYLAPPGRDRIQEFIDARGLGGTIVDQELPDAKPPDAKDAEAAIAAQHAKNARQQAAARAVMAEAPAVHPVKPSRKQWGGLTPLIFATREGDLDSVKILLAAGADVNRTSEFGWTALLTATQNKYYQIGVYLLEHGADPNIQNEGGWSPLYIATDNRNIEGGDYPVRKPDMDHLDFIKRLLAAGAKPNLRMHSSTETRTVFTHQWLYEEGATPFLRAAQSGDLVLMKLLLEHGADPKIPTDYNVTPLMVASGIGWVEGVTYEWSAQQTLETVKFLLDLGADVNAQDTMDGRTALMGAAHKGRNDVVQLLVDHGANLGAHDIGSRDTIHSLAGVTWQAIDYADGLVRVGVQSSIAHPQTAALIRKLMSARGLPVPPAGRTLASICITDLCQ